MRAFAELNEKGDRIIVQFPFDRLAVAAIKRVPGARFISREKGGPHWQLPLDLVSARRLREEFSDGLELGVGVREWGREKVVKETKLRSLSVLDDVPIKDLVIKQKLPKLAKWLRPYQRADVKFLATTNALNLNEQRLGKTVEIIGAIYEADLELGPHLVVAPQKSLDSVWRMEIEKWTDGRVFTYSGNRKDDMDDFSDMLSHHVPIWWITTADMIRRGQYPLEGLNYEWNTLTIDEYHKTGLAEIKNKFPKAVNMIKAKRKFAMSGTPMGGKPIKLWGGLHFLEPDQYTSKWRWADQWLEVERGSVYVKGKVVKTYEIGGIQEGREDAFYQSLAPHSVRRLREEVLPQLPPKLKIDVWCEMTKKQQKQYDQFAADTEIRIDEQYLSATSVLAEYTRLKQFSNSYCEVEVVGHNEESDEPKLKVRATPESGKLPFLLERLAEAGIDPEDPTGDSQAIVASQFRETIEMVSRYLTEKGIPNIMITGKVSKAESERAQRAFKADADHEGLRVVCMVTTMGVGITLDNVESVHLLDETWNPDDQDQLSDRAINTSRLHQVNVLTYRSRGTIEEYIDQIATEKAITNRNILDIRRMMSRGKVAA